MEHVLLAAHRTGRKRAGLVAGIRQHAEREKEILARELELIKARQGLTKSMARGVIEVEAYMRSASSGPGMVLSRKSRANATCMGYHS
jgi:hypothetical protein